MDVAASFQNNGISLIRDDRKIQSFQLTPKTTRWLFDPDSLIASREIPDEKIADEDGDLAR
jgi:hypothetical protein